MDILTRGSDIRIKAGNTAYIQGRQSVEIDQNSGSASPSVASALREDVTKKEENKEKEKHSAIYVKDLKADKPEAQPNEKVTFTVTKYSQEKVSENDKKRIQWAIKIDDKQEVLKEKGEKLVLTIKEEWAGKRLS